MVIHKVRYEKDHGLIFPYLLCLSPDLDEESYASYHWSNITCKNCLRSKPKKAKRKARKK